MEHRLEVRDGEVIVVFSDFINGALFEWADVLRDGRLILTDRQVEDARLAFQRAAEREGA